MGYLKCFVVFAVLMVIASTSAATQSINNEIQPRTSCDLIGGGIWCSGHCIAKGRPGGFCDKEGTCVCKIGGWACNSLGDGGCTASCLLKGRVNGGYCSNGLCICN